MGKKKSGEKEKIPKIKKKNDIQRKSKKKLR